MRRGLIILALGITGAWLAYWCVYRMGTTTPRTLMRSAQPELAWLQHEFNLGDTEFARISELHAGYIPQCKERCARIEELNEKLSMALAASTDVTPEIQKLIEERSRMRAHCQTEMLKHFFEVSRTMPAEQSKRYLAWVRQNTCLREEKMNHGDEASSAARSPLPMHHYH